MMLLRILAGVAMIACCLSAATRHATGTFDVKLTEQPSDDIARMLIDKQFHGDIEGVSKGQMISAGNDTAGVYVAIERVTGSVHGHKGSFLLHHTGIASSKGQELAVTVVPESGTGELKGISGTMAIIITGKQHFYDFDYTLP